MKPALIRPQLNRSWLLLGAAMALGIVATGLRHEGAQDPLARLESQVRAAYRMVSTVAAKKELTRSAQIRPAVSARREVPAEYGSTICL
jgi:pilus assembly protein CpaB